MTAVPNAAAALTQVERDSLAQIIRWHGQAHAEHPEATYLYLAVENTLDAVEHILSARLDAGIQQADPQPDEREALAEMLAADEWPDLTWGQIVAGSTPARFRKRADAVLAAGFRRHPDTGLRARIESVLSDPRHRWWHAGGTQCSPLYAIRDALAEPTPESGA